MDVELDLESMEMDPFSGLPDSEYETVTGLISDCWEIVSSVNAGLNFGSVMMARSKSRGSWSTRAHRAKYQGAVAVSRCFLEYLGVICAKRNFRSSSTFI